MFTHMTEVALAANLSTEAGGCGWATLPPDAYRELVRAARDWDAFRSRIAATYSQPNPIDLTAEPMTILAGVGVATNRK